MSLIENIKFLRKKKKFTQEKLAQALGINRPSIGAYEESRAYPKLVTLTEMAKLFGVTVDEMINEDLSKKNYLASKKNVKVLGIALNKNADKKYIPLVPNKATAGYTNGYQDPEYLTNLPKFHIPVLPKGTYRAFEISGDSMLPLVSGSIVIGKYIEQLADIKNGTTYILVTKSEGIVYKRVFNYLKEKNKLFLVSDNDSYAPYTLEPIEIVEIWEAKAYISVEFPNPTSTNELSKKQVIDMMGNLKNDVEQLKKDSN